MTAVHEKGGFCGCDVKMLGLRYKWAHSVVQAWCKHNLSEAKALQRRVIRVSMMFEEHRRSGDARLEREWKAVFP